MTNLIKSAAFCAFVLSAAGCTGPNAFTFTSIGDNFKSSFGMVEKPKEPIQRIEAIWKGAKGHDMNGNPCRGAAGQILFFTASSEAPVRLLGEGKVVVYVFDNLGKPEEQNKPIHKFLFDMPAWNKHLRVAGQLGPTYHVFIPYRATS